MNFLIDMNLSPAWADFLGGAGYKAVHWSNEGAPDASDRELMDWAAENGFMIVTADLDFAAILAATRRQSPSVILVRSGSLTPETVGSAVLAAIRQARAELLAGAIISVDAEKARIRVLPLAGR
jgi:predicted nuclease of predicted toxin-antitoxin system